MTEENRAALKDIICYVAEDCSKCPFPNCRWRDTPDEKLIFFAAIAVKKANPLDKKRVTEYAKLTGVEKFLAPKAKII